MVFPYGTHSWRCMDPSAFCVIVQRSFKASVRAGASRGLWEAKSCAGNTRLEDVRGRLTCITEATLPVSTLLANSLCLCLVMIKSHWGTFRHTTESFFILVHGKRLWNSTVQWQFNANNMGDFSFSSNNIKNVQTNRNN